MSNQGSRSDEPTGREPGPDGRKDDSCGGDTRLTPDELRVLREALLEMRRNRPHFYAVVKLWMESGGYRGFYKDVADKLQITPNGVKYRFQAALAWLSETLKKGTPRWTG